MRTIILTLLLLMFSASEAAAVDCKKPRRLQEYLDCGKVQEAEKAVAVFRTAGEQSSYWPCLSGELEAAGKRASTANNPIDTDDELTKVIIDAQLACEQHFAAFEAALRKEAVAQGFDD